jgi:hypothetical protein
MKKPHHTARAGLTNNTICTDTVKFDRKAVKAQLLQDFNVEHPFWKDNPDDYQFAPHQRSYVERGVVTDFFKEYEDLLNVQRIWPQQEFAGGKRNPEENVSDSETNENPRKKAFSHDTTKEGWEYIHDKRKDPWRCSLFIVNQKYYKIS